MKLRKTLQMLVSFFIAFAMVLPGAVKVEAADSYPVDQNSIVLDADFTGASTNNHTFAKAIWTYDNFVYLMVDSTHDVESITLYSGSGSITSSTPMVHGYTVSVGGTIYKADESKGNVKDSHLTVFKFSLSEILTTLKLNENGVYTIDVISEQGEGHWITGGTLTIHIPKAKVKITKTWEDGPKDDVSIQLYRKLKDAEDSTYTAFGDAFTLTTTNPMKTISELNFTDNIGRIYTYTAKEVNIGEGYVSTVNMTGPKLVHGVQVFTIAIKNTYTPPRTDISVTKVWKDETAEDRPATLIYKLYADEEKEPVRTETVSGPNYNYTFEDLPKTHLDGTVIKYSVGEVKADGYTTSIDGLTITNTRSGITDVDVEKLWKDGDDPSGRPKEGVTFNLLADGSEVDSALLTAPDWKHTFKNLDKYNEEGELIDYTVTEDPVEGYTPTIDGLTITNVRSGITSVSGSKTWMDENSTSMRPESITVDLLQNDIKIDSTNVTEIEGLWAYSFKDLPMFDDNGIAYSYSIDEVSVPGYETSYDGFDIFNLRTGILDIPVEKIWLDNGERAVEEITVNLYSKSDMESVIAVDAEETSVAEPMEFVKALVLNAENEWKGTFENLPEFNELGYPIEYILVEESVEGYTETVKMNEDGSYTFTNLRTGFVDIAGEKTWFDENEEDRPEFITVVLMRNGEEIDRMDVTEAEGLWAYSFDDLPEFDEEGAMYLYEIEELPVEDYTTEILGYDIHNIRTGLVNVNGEKTWDDLMDRPESITINLLQNGVEIDDAVVTKDEEERWTYSFTELPEFDEDGIAYEYSVTEDAITGYEATVEGYNILNRQMRGTLRIVKTDDFDFPVEDAIFEIEDEDGVLVDTVSTDEDGIAVSVLPLGTYTVREIYAPEDYIMDDEEKTVTLEEDGETVALSVVNILELEEVEPLPLPTPKPKPTLPQTGAQGSFIWYGMGAIVALAGFTLLRKKETSL